jgi:hypothetical protein
MMTAAQKRWHAANREHVKKRMRRDLLRREYGLTEEAFQVLVEVQNNKCAICRQDLGEGMNRCVDHDHVTGRVRGLLCRTCNLGLGYFKDSVQNLQSAQEYLNVGPR